MSPRYLHLPCGHRGRLRARPTVRRRTPWAGTIYEIETPIRAAMRSLAVWVAITIAGAALVLAALFVGVATLIAWVK